MKIHIWNYVYDALHMKYNNTSTSQMRQQQQKHTTHTILCTPGICVYTWYESITRFCFLSRVFPSNPGIVQFIHTSTHPRIFYQWHTQRPFTLICIATNLCCAASQKSFRARTLSSAWVDRFVRRCIVHHYIWLWRCKLETERWTR